MTPKPKPGRTRRGRTPRRTARSPRTRRTPGGWWAGLCCGALLLLSPGTSLVLVVLLLPGLVALGAGGRHHPTARVMLLFGMAGSVSGLFRLLGAGAGVGAAMNLLRSPAVVATAWAAAGAGWLVTEAVAATIALTWFVRDGVRTRAVEREIAEIEEEWGPIR